MTIKRRLERLEVAFGLKAETPIAFDVPLDLQERVRAAKRAGTFPQSLSAPDQRAILEAYDNPRNVSG